VEFIRATWDQAPANVGSLMTLRGGGVSAAPYDDGCGGGGLNLGTHVGDDPACVQHNRRLLRQVLPAEPAWLSQVHGTRVVDAATAGSIPASADASIATQPGVVCAVLTADCLPVLLCDRAGHVVGAAHAGWRGLQAGVLERTLEAMRAAGASDILAWLGPAIGPQAFEVGAEVRQAFVEQDVAAGDAFASTMRIDKYRADIYQLARMRLHNAGVELISGGGRCTVAERESFYSYRRDGVTGRMGSFIWLA